MRLQANTRMLAVASALMLAVAVSSRPTAAQEGFHNPAMETSEEFKLSFKRASELARRDPEAAIDEFKRAAGLRGGKCPECHQSIAQIYFQFGEYKNAAAAYRQAVEFKPSNAADLYNALGVSLYLLKDKKMYDEAVVALTQAIDLSKGKHTKAYFNLGCALIKAGREEEGIAALKTYLERAPSAADAEDVRRMVANPKLAGESFARGFKVKSTAGNDLSLEKFKGKVVLLDFWAVWCGPCRVDMPKVKTIWKKYSADRFVMIGVNLDSNRKTFEDYVEQEGLTWPHYFDGLRWDNKLARLYGVTAIPHTVLIDQEGIIRGVGLRGGDLSNKIGELLKNSSKSEPAGSN